MEKLITKCVLQGVVFDNALGAGAYTVQDLVHALSLNNINSLWKKAKKKLSELDTDSLFENASTEGKRKLQLQVDTLEAIFKYKYEQAEAAKKREEEREARSQKLATLKNLKTQKELEELGKMSLEDIEKEILNLS